MLRSIEFIHEGRRYSGKVAPVPGGGPEFEDGAWFVSMNGAPSVGCSRPIRKTRTHRSSSIAS